MKYKKFGDTGIEVSVLGLGGMRLPGYREDNKYINQVKAIKFVRQAFDLGINYFDTGYPYVHGLGESIIGKAIKGIRDNLYISTKTPLWLLHKKSDYQKYLKEQLKNLDIEYIDFYHFHGLSELSYREKVLKFDLLDKIIRSKEKGLIKHISFSFHDTSDVAEKMIDIGIFESMLVQYNLLDTTLEEGISYAAKKGVGVAIMGPLGGGRVVSLKNSESFKGSHVDFAALGLKFVLSNKNISMVLTGTENIGELKRNIKTACGSYELSAEEKKIVEEIKSQKENLELIPCTSCEYCMPCPQKVLIPKIFKLYNYLKLSGRIDIAKRGYNNDIGYLGYKTATSCKECSKCEKKCPQKIDIINNLKKCHTIHNTKQLKNYC